MNHLVMFLYGLLGAYVYAVLMKLDEDGKKALAEEFHHKEVTSA